MTPEQARQRIRRDLTIGIAKEFLKSHVREDDPGCPCDICRFAKSFIAATSELTVAKAEIGRLREAALALVDAMETCHQCSATLLVEDGPTYCSESGCSSDCEDHEDRDKPNCIPISNLHGTLKRILKALAAPPEPTKKENHGIQD